MGSNHSQSDGSLYNWRIWALNIAVIIVMLLFSLVMSLFFCRQNQLKAKVSLEFRIAIPRMVAPCLLFHPFVPRLYCFTATQHRRVESCSGKRINS